MAEEMKRTDGSFNWLDVMPGGVLVYQAEEEKRILYVNERAVRLFGCETEEEFLDFCKGSYARLIDREDARHLLVLAQLARQAENNTFGRTHYRVKTRVGGSLPIETFGRLARDPVFGDVIILFLTPSEGEEVIIHDGSDVVTQLLRMGPFLTIGSKMIRGSAHAMRYHVVYFNIRNFKLYNVRHGKTAGDRILRHMADLMTRYGNEDLLARFADDHFVILSGVDNEELLRRLQEIYDDFSLTHARDGLDLKVGIYPVADQSENLAKACDFAKTACDSIHDSVRAYYCFYDPEMSRTLEVQAYAVRQIDEALEREEIHVYYQPVVRTLGGGLCGLEALSRWLSPKGMLSPGCFVPALENSRQSHKLDLYVVRQVCRRMNEELDAGRPVVPVSFNLSRMDFLTCDVFAEIEQIRSGYHIPRDMLRVEVTESVLIGDSQLILTVIRKFQAAGYQVWMDDFGSGYSSLNQLSEYSFDELKLDMGFLSKYTDGSKAVVKNTVRMAKEMGIQTLAEGVETREQFEFLRQVGCEKAQGYYFGKPLPYEETMAACRKKGLIPERRIEQGYYDRLGKVDLITDRPQAIIEYKEDQFSYLYSNDAYWNEVLGDSGSSREVVFYNLNDPTSPLARLFRQFQYTIPDGEETRQLDYSVGSSYTRVRARRIARCQEKMAYQVEVTDITQAAMRENVEQNDRIARLLYLLFDAVYVLDLDRDLVESLAGSGHQNSSLRKKGKLSVEEAMSITMREIIHPRDWPAFERFIDTSTMQERIAQNDRGVVSGVFRSREANGAYVWKTHRVMHLPRAGRSFLYTVLYTKLSDTLLMDRMVQELKVDLDRMDQLDFWKSFVEMSPVRMFWKDRERRFLGVNRAFLDYYGLDSEEELLGKTDEQMHWHIHDGPYHDDEERVLLQGETIRSSPGRCIVQGKLRNILATKVPLYHEREISGLIGYFVDMEEIDRATRQVENIQLVDQGTGMLNARGLLTTLADYVDCLNNTGQAFAMIRLTIPRYDRTVYTYGERFARRFLTACSQVILDQVKTKAVCARVYGANFVVCIQCTPEEEEQVEGLRDRLRGSIAAIHQVDGCAVTLNPETGLTFVCTPQGITQLLGQLLAEDIFA